MRPTFPARPVAAIAALVVWSSTQTLSQAPPRDLPPPPEVDRRWLGPIDKPEPDGRWRPQALDTGEPLSFRQEPPLVLARDDQGAGLSNFTVVGDVARVRFDRWNPEQGEFEAETWERDRTENVGGRLVSLFQPSWSADTIQALLSRSRVGLDRPFVYLGSFRGAADAPRIAHAVLLRVGRPRCARCRLNGLTTPFSTPATS
ncbi:MAG: hypothetical protein OEW19_16605 [Acidobacteriota bacterium]|nr:hypothetical protein [Acidobacteriota bacterium]